MKKLQPLETPRRRVTPAEVTYIYCCRDDLSNFVLGTGKTQVEAKRNGTKRLQQLFADGERKPGEVLVRMERHIIKRYLTVFVLHEQVARK